MTGQAKTAIVTSITLHIIAFIVLMGVKLYYGELNAEGEMPVAFVSIKKTKPRRRSDLIRPNIMLYRPPQNLSQEQPIVHLSHESSDVFYTDAPQQPYSTARAAERAGFSGQADMQPLPMNKTSGMVSPMGVTILKETQPPETQLLQYNIASGRDFLKEAPVVQAKPRLKDILQTFTRTVRKMIEAKKRYPLTARKSMIEGRVGVKMTILRNGQLERTEIVESSGHSILDRAALESVRRSAPFPPLPKDAERKRIQINIYLVYKMT